MSFPFILQPFPVSLSNSLDANSQTNLQEYFSQNVSFELFQTSMTWFLLCSTKRQNMLWKIMTWGEFCIASAFVKHIQVWPNIQVNELWQDFHFGESYPFKLTPLGVNLLTQCYFSQQECFKRISMILNVMLLTSSVHKKRLFKNYAFPACQQKPVPQDKVFTSCRLHHFHSILH